MCPYTFIDGWCTENLFSSKSKSTPVKNDLLKVKATLHFNIILWLIFFILKAEKATIVAE